MISRIIVSFVHGYQDLDDDRSRVTEELPALWINEPRGQAEVAKFPFPRNPADFAAISDLISGERPLRSARDFDKLPRFGLTGLAETGDYIYAGSWNSLYEIRKSDYSLSRLISHSLMNDMHGIWADDEYLITILTGKDTVVLSDHSGEIVDHFTIANDLTVYRDDNLQGIDWRFLSKQFRGATGLYHFNYVQRFGDEIWLTARNLGAFVVVNLKTKKSHLRTLNQKTVVLIHDGLRYEGHYYFTSIDGKILIAAEPHASDFQPREQFEGIELFTRDLVCELIRLEETEFARQPNWCRGIACADDILYVTVDGRYDSNLSFGLLGLKRDGSKVLERRLRWQDVGSEKELRYVTGFDVLAF
ncbi:MAG: hypothetical protein K9L88_02350 [Chromatiaceae bacterium]|nr:hypothetical protein [Chromatiaceae bacterium]